MDPDLQKSAKKPETGDAADSRSRGVVGGVNGCICFDVSFEKIKEIASDSEQGLLDAHRKTGCGGRCGLCLPYIKLMLMTGRTSLPVMWSDEFAKAGINPGRIKAIEQAIARQQASMDAEAEAAEGKATSSKKNAAG